MQALTSEHRIQYDTHWEQKTCCCSRHAGKGGSHSRASSEQHGSHKNICHQTESDVYKMSNSAVSGMYHFEEGMRVRSPTLEFDGECSE